MRRFKFKNLIVLFLIVIMSLTPISAFADGDEGLDDANKGSTESSTEEDKNKDEDKSSSGALTVEDLYLKAAPIGIRQGTDTCTEAATTMVVYNCYSIKSEYQIEDKYKDRDSYDAKLSGSSIDAPAVSTVTAPGEKIRQWGDETFRNADIVGGNEGTSGLFYNSDGTVLIGDENKLFVEMTEAEFANAVKRLWSKGYFMVMGLRYKKTSTGDLGEYNVDGAKGYWKTEGTDCNDSTYFVPHDTYGYDPNSAKGKWNGKDYKISSNHAVYLVGAVDDKVYIRDPSWKSFHDLHTYGDGITLAYEGYDVAFQPAYIVAWQSDVTSPMKLAGGKMPALTDKEKEDADKNGRPTYQVGNMTFYAEQDLSAWVKLDEVDINALYLFGASRDNLTKTDIDALSTWEDEVNEGKWSFTKALRVMIMVMGIIITVWAIFFYLAYWLDRINNFVDIDFIPLLSLGKFRISEDETEASYGFTDKKRKGKVVTVNHRAVLKIVVIAVGFGCLMITGLIYKLVFWIISTVTGWFK